MATRIYLPSSGAAPTSPSYDAGWNNTSIAARVKAVTARASTAMTTVSFDDADVTNLNILFRQWVSDPLAAQTLTAQTVKLQIGASETNGGNTLFLAWTVRVVSDGGTVRGTCVGSPRRDATEIAVTTLTNRGDSLTSTAVVAQVGDRLVIEIGVGGDPSLGQSHDSSLRIGDNDATDLPEDDTTTADNNPWIEFANTISFDVISVSVAGSQPAATGTVARKKLGSLAGAQPAPSATIAALQSLFRSLAGSQPSATGALAVKHLRLLGGNQPSASGAIKLVLFRTLSGNQPSATGSLTQKLAILLAGSQPTATGSVAALQSLFRTLTGNQPSAAGSLQLKYFRLLTGNQPGASGQILTLYKRLLAGSQPFASGSLALKHLRALAGSQPSASGTLGRLQSLFRTLSGNQPAPSGALTKKALVIVRGNQPNATGLLLLLHKRKLLGNQPAATGLLLFIFPNSSSVLLDSHAFGATMVDEHAFGSVLSDEAAFGGDELDE